MLQSPARLIRDLRRAVMGLQLDSEVQASSSTQQQLLLRLSSSCRQCGSRMVVVRVVLVMSGSSCSGRSHWGTLRSGWMQGRSGSCSAR